MSQLQFLKVIDAKYEHDYVLRLTFNTGNVRLCDFLPLAQRVSVPSCRIWNI